MQRMTLITTFFFLIVASAFASTFEERKQIFIQQVANLDGYEEYQRHSLWAYLLKEGANTAEEKNRIHLIIRSMVLGYDSVIPELGYDDDTVGWYKSIHMDNALIYRVLLQFRDRITQEDYNWALARLQESIQDNAFLIGCNGNQRLMQLVGLYLYGERLDRNATIQYYRAAYMGDQWDNFVYEGRSYVIGSGNRYNAYQFAKDYLQYTFNRWLHTTNYVSSKGPDEYWEFDSGYSHSYITGLAILYDLALDPEIKQKARMMLDFYILDYFLDYSALDHGGAEGRSASPGRYNFEWILFGFERPMHPAYPSRDFFTSSYTIPAIIQDIIDLSDEPDDYFHVHHEYNPRLHDPGFGKETFVTKYFNLGGAISWGWELNVLCQKANLLTLTLAVSDNPPEDTYWFRGGQHTQYRNLIDSQGAYLNANGWQYFDKNESSRGWRFLKLGKTLIAIKDGWLEVYVEGVDFNSYAEFKAAVLANSSAGQKSAKGVYINQELAKQTVPFKRLETSDNQGNILVDFDQDVLTLSKHGRIRRYDFNSWEIYDSDQDVVPPNSPAHLIASQVHDTELTLQWNPPAPASDGENASRYVIFRDGTQIASTTETSFADNGLTGGESYQYEVYAFDQAGNRSEAPASITVSTLSDVTPPVVENMEIEAADQVRIYFSENVEQNSSETLANYSITPNLSLTPTVGIIQATLSNDLRTVILQTGNHASGQNYTLTVQNVKDRAEPPNQMQAPQYLSYSYQKVFKISNLTPAIYDTAHLVLGDQIYIDRDYVLQSLPESLRNLVWIRTANDHKESADTTFMVFTISDRANVYVGYDRENLQIPSWLSTWALTSAQIVTNDATFNVYSKTFPAGQVILGGNQGYTKSSMYLVILDNSNNDFTPPNPPQGIAVRRIGE
jgi:hypothetical protein